MQKMGQIEKNSKKLYVLYKKKQDHFGWQVKQVENEIISVRVAVVLWHIWWKIFEMHESRLYNTNNLGIDQKHDILSDVNVVRKTLLIVLNLRCVQSIAISIYFAFVSTFVVVHIYIWVMSGNAFVVQSTIE